MMDYEKLDAWKACHALVIAVIEATKGVDHRDPDLIYHLNRTALRAAGKLAFGCGTRNKKMFFTSVQRSAGYLSSLAYCLSLVRVMGVLSEETCVCLDALRGRASFYTRQLFEALLVPPSGDEDADAHD